MSGKLTCGFPGCDREAVFEMVEASDGLELGNLRYTCALHLVRMLPDPPFSVRVKNLETGRVFDYRRVKSSNIEAIGYCPQLQELHVGFKSGGLYAYEGVGQDVVEGLLQATSLGRFFHANVKNAFVHRDLRVRDEEEDPLHAEPAESPAS